MKTLLRILTFGAMLGACTQLAHANPILTNGSTLRFCCNATVAVTGSGASTVLSFTTNPGPAINGTGGLGIFDGATSIVLANTFAVSGITPGSGQLLFTTSAAGHTVQFFVTGYTTSGGNLVFTGYLTDNGVAGSNATLVEKVGNKAPGTLGNYYEGDLTLTPEPSSLVLLGTGLAGAAGLMMRKRRMAKV